MTSLFEDKVTWQIVLFTALLTSMAALIIGIMNCFTFTPICLAAAVILMMIGCMLIAMEAPCCCPFLDFIQPLGRWSDARPHLQKAILYGVCAVVPIALCFTLTQLLSCALIMATAVFYGLMALGKKLTELRWLCAGKDNGRHGDESHVD